jgi:hypothetical protein
MYEWIIDHHLAFFIIVGSEIDIAELRKIWL